MRRTARAAAVTTLVLALGVLVACGGGSKPSAKPSGSGSPSGATSPTPPAPPPPVYSKLTGLDIKTEPTHPVIVVKIDNTASSKPQVGLGSADLVTEELVEGGVTRLAVMFDSVVPPVVGPVRSFRASDIGIVKPSGAVLVASGGAAVTVSRVKAAGITTYTEGATGFYRDKKRKAPYNLMMQLSTLVPTIKATTRPQDFLPLSTTPVTLPAGQAATAFTVSFPSSVTKWAFDGTRYANTNSNAAAGDQFAPDTVLVLRVAIGDAGYRDPAGHPVPETKFFGTGAAQVFHGGQVVDATWSKTALDSPLTLSTAAGPLSLPPGKIWMELVPNTAKPVSVTAPAAAPAS